MRIAPLFAEYVNWASAELATPKEQQSAAHRKEIWLRQNRTRESFDVRFIGWLLRNRCSRLQGTPFRRIGNLGSLTGAIEGTVYKGRVGQASCLPVHGASRPVPLRNDGQDARLTGRQDACPTWL